MARRIILSAILIPILALIVYADLLLALPFFVFILALSLLADRELFGLVGRIEDGEETKRLMVGFLLPAPLFLCFSYAKELSRLPHVTLLYAVGALTLFLLLFPFAALQCGALQSGDGAFESRARTSRVRVLHVRASRSLRWS